MKVEDWEGKTVGDLEIKEGVLSLTTGPKEISNLLNTPLPLRTPVTDGTSVGVSVRMVKNGDPDFIGALIDKLSYMGYSVDGWNEEEEP